MAARHTTFTITNTNRTHVWGWRDFFCTSGSKAAQLLARPNKRVSRAALMREVWKTDFVEDTRTLEVHIDGLRRIIEESPRRPRRIVTVRGSGYCWVVDQNQDKGGLH